MYYLNIFCNCVKSYLDVSLIECYLWHQIWSFCRLSSQKVLFCGTVRNVALPFFDYYKCICLTLDFHSLLDLPFPFFLDIISLDESKRLLFYTTCGYGTLLFKIYYNMQIYKKYRLS
jgi:hypothetical protein